MLIAALLSVLAAPQAFAKTHIVSASIFKNNYALVTRRIDVPASGTVLLDVLPHSTLATLWFESTSGLKMQSITASDVIVERSDPIGDALELLQANVGKRVTLEFSGQKPGVTGKVISVSPKIVLLDEGGATGAYQTQDIVRTKILDTAKTSTRVQLKKRVLRIVISGNRSGGLYFSDLEPGLNWAPAYALNITDRLKLKFTAKATIIDDLDPLEKIEANLVTGFPSALYSGELDPLVTFPIIATQSQSYAKTNLSGGLGYLPQGINRITYDPTDNSLVVAGSDGTVGAPNPTGRAEGDLFFYRQLDVSLQPGERGYFVLNQGEIDYTETYKWTGQDSIQGNTIRYTGPIGSAVDKSDVIHSLRFTNSTGQPLTSGPASIYRDQQLLGQGLLGYTPKGGVAEVKINNALDVHVEARDEETARDRDAKHLTVNTTADLITVKTTIEVQNFKDEAITLTARHPFTGEVIDGQGGTVTYDRTSAFALNRSGTIEWELNLPAGATKTVTFTLKAYVVTGSGT